MKLQMILKCSKTEVVHDKLSDLPEFSIRKAAAEIQSRSVFRNFLYYIIISFNLFSGNWKPETVSPVGELTYLRFPVAKCSQKMMSFFCITV